MDRMKLPYDQRADIGTKPAFAGSSQSDKVIVIEQSPDEVGTGSVGLGG